MSPLEWNRRQALRAGLLVFGASPLALILDRIQLRRKAEIFRTAFEAFGTRVHLAIFGAPRPLAQLAAREATEEALQIQRLMTTHDPASQLSRVNRSSGVESLPVDSRISQVVARALEFSRLTGGLFDITTLPLLQAWGLRNYRFDEEIDETQLRSALEKVGYWLIRSEGGRLGLSRRGAAMDLGGIAKGFAVDRMVSILGRRGIRRAIVEAGGDLFALGSPPDSEAWTIGVEDPRGGGLCGTLALRDAAVATSGIRHSYVLRRGKRVGHLFDPASGLPAARFASTSAVASNTMDADALSSSLFVASGRPLIEPPRSLHGWLHVSLKSDHTLRFEEGGRFPGWSPSEPVRVPPEFIQRS